MLFKEIGAGPEASIPECSDLGQCHSTSQQEDNVYSTHSKGGFGYSNKMMFNKIQIRCEINQEALQNW